jgi:hypothetical protein
MSSVGMSRFGVSPVTREVIPMTEDPRRDGGLPRRGLWNEAEIASSGIGGGRAQVASVAEAPCEPGSLACNLEECPP